MIGAAIGATFGIVIAVVIIIFLFRIKNELADAKTAKDTADVIRLKGEVTTLQASLALRDSAALLASKTFVTARTNATTHPVVTGGGPKADAIANAAVNACFATATDALTKCQLARLTADSLPVLKDSVSALEKRLAAGLHPRWTARGYALYSWPERKPLLRVDTDFRLFNSLSATAGAEALIAGPAKTRADSARQNWRVYAGASIPFR
jgi:hypothetical protein